MSEHVLFRPVRTDDLKYGKHGLNRDQVFECRCFYCHRVLSSSLRVLAKHKEKCELYKLKKPLWGKLK